MLIKENQKVAVTSKKFIMQQHSKFMIRLLYKCYMKCYQYYCINLDYTRVTQEQT